MTASSVDRRDGSCHHMFESYHSLLCVVPLSCMWETSGHGNMQKQARHIRSRHKDIESICNLQRVQKKSIFHSTGTQFLRTFIGDFFTITSRRFPSSFNFFLRFAMDTYHTSYIIHVYIITRGPSHNKTTYIVWTTSFSKDFKFFTRSTFFLSQGHRGYKFHMYLYLAQ